MTHPTTTPRGSATTGVQRLFERLGLTARPESFAAQFRNSSAVWLALMTYWSIERAWTDRALRTAVTASGNVSTSIDMAGEIKPVAAQIARCSCPQDLQEGSVCRRFR